MAVDGSGNVHTTGYFRGTVDFDPGANVSNLDSIGEAEIYVSKLDSAGDFVWARQIGGTDFDGSTDLAVDATGNVYTTGYFFGTIDFDPGAGVSNLTPVGGSDIFVSKLDSTGDFVWVGN